MISIEKEMSVQEKLKILSAAAKYDVACTSSGADRRGRKGKLGNSRAYGICHSFSADGRCVSLLKILMSNHCIFDCKYCANRSSNDIERASFTPQEICELTVEFYKRNYIEGLFLSSGIMYSPQLTMEKICQTLLLLRNDYGFNGYIHVKAIPGAPDELIAIAGHLADRMSINMELPTNESLRRLAPHKSMPNILSPMRKISTSIAASRLSIGKNAKMERSGLNQYIDSIFSIGEDRSRIAAGSFEQPVFDMTKADGASDIEAQNMISGDGGELYLPPKARRSLNREFVPAGQSTQMIIGASDESDYSILRTVQYLYRRYDLKRVFYSAYIPVNEDAALPSLDTPVPMLREHRLYQADWLLRFYGFQAEELLSAESPDFNALIDPKCNWALNNIGLFPIEVQTADTAQLLRVPGIGPGSARRIVEARKYGRLSFEILKKMGVVLKRANYFITCNGKMLYPTRMEEEYIKKSLSLLNRGENMDIENKQELRQLSIFDA